MITFEERVKIMITYENIKNSPEIRAYITRADQSLNAMGYTEHSFPHVMKVADTASKILKDLGASERDQELAKIAGYMHDIGNLVNRADHSQSGAILAFRILEKMGMDPEEIATVVTAIGNHDEGTGIAVNPVAAALILADKSDVRSSRVRNSDPATFDIHDRVNGSVSHATLTVSEDKTAITLTLTIDTSISPVIDYFQIFMGRMIMCKNAAQTLGLSFRLTVNGQSLM